MIRIYKKYFLSLPTKYWKNGRSQANNSQDLAKTLEMLEEWKKLQKKKIIQSNKNIFFHFPKNIGRMEEARQKNSQDLAKTLEMLEEWKKLWKKK